MDRFSETGLKHKCYVALNAIEIFYSGLSGCRFFAQKRAAGEETQEISNQARPENFHQLANCIERKIERAIKKDGAEYGEKVFGSESRYY